jgi:phenylpyruvate tautomerase PptA (4-oxalocrotonate tautomerase family)
MPVLFIEAPQGVGPEAKRRLMQKLTEAIDETYRSGDTRDGRQAAVGEP